MIKENERFLIFVEQIKTIKSYLEKLNYKGYPKNIDIIIEINQGEISPKIVNIKKEYTSLEELICIFIIIYFSSIKYTILINDLNIIDNEQQKFILKIYEKNHG